MFDSNVELPRLSPAVQRFADEWAALRANVSGHTMAHVHLLMVRHGVRIRTSYVQRKLDCKAAGISAIGIFDTLVDKFSSHQDIEVLEVTTTTLFMFYRQQVIAWIDISIFEEDGIAITIHADRAFKDDLERVIEEELPDSTHISIKRYKINSKRELATWVHCTHSGVLAGYHRLLSLPVNYTP